MCAVYIILILVTMFAIIPLWVIHISMSYNESRPVKWTTVFNVIQMCDKLKWYRCYDHKFSVFAQYGDTETNVHAGMIIIDNTSYIISDPFSYLYFTIYTMYYATKIEATSWTDMYTACYKSEDK